MRSDILYIEAQSTILVTDSFVGNCLPSAEIISGTVMHGMRCKVTRESLDPDIHRFSVQHVISNPVVPQVDVEEIEEGGLIEPDPGVNDQAQAAAEAVAVAEQPERELHSFEIEGAQVQSYTHE